MADCRGYLIDDDGETSPMPDAPPRPDDDEDEEDDDPEEEEDEEDTP